MAVHGNRLHLLDLQLHTMTGAKNTNDINSEPRDSPPLEDDPKSSIAAPIPIKRSKFKSLGQDHHGLDCLTPNTTKRVSQRKPSYGTIEVSREAHYNLDYPEDSKLLAALQLDPNSRFYARNIPRTLNLPQLLPYETELPKDQAKFLSHIVSHLYVAVKTLDIQGSLSVTAKDLAALKNISGLSDLDIALETNLFEMNSDNTHPNDDESNNYFLMDDYGGDSDSDFDDEDDEDEDGDEDNANDVDNMAVDDNDRNESAVQHKKSPKSAAVVSVRIWTNELLVWLKMKYDMPISLRIALAKVYFAICLCRGQYINLKIYVRAFELLTKDVELLKQNGLQLDWKDLFNELQNHFPSVDSSIDNFEKKDHKQLLRLAERSSNFFDAKALPIIFDKLGQNLSISNSSLVICSMALLPLSFSKDGVNSIYDIRHYISSFFYIWKKFHKSHGLDSHITSRFGTIAMAGLIDLSNFGSDSVIKLDEYCLFTKDQIQLLINNLLNCLSIMPNKYSSNKSNFFHGYASALVYSINPATKKTGNEDIVDRLNVLLNAIESYVHPTNSGEWTKPISKLIYSLIYQFHKRYNQEREEFGALYNLSDDLKLDNDTVHRFVKTLLPVVRTGLQSKRAGAVDSYLSCLSLLAHLDSETVLETVLLDLYESLEGVISTHRVNVALRSLDELARYFATTKIYRVHLTRLLLLAVPGIDSNDLEKTLLTLNVFQAVANFVPFYDLTNGEGDPNLAIQFTQGHMEFLQQKVYTNFSSGDGDMMTDGFECDDELEIQALKSSTSAFKTLLKTLTQRIFTLLENIPDPNKSGNMERAIADSLPKYLYIIFESVSDDIFKLLRDLIFDFVFDNTIHTVADMIAEVCGSLIKRDPSAFPKYCELLISRIQEDIEENGSGNSRSGVDIVPRDQALFWYLIILNECIGNANSYVVNMSNSLQSFVDFLMDHVRGPTVFASSYLVNQMLQSVTKIKIKEMRLILPLHEEKYGIDETCWGAFQFQKDRFSDENLCFDWYMPSVREVKFAIDFFTDTTSKILSNILSLMNSYSSDTGKESSSSSSLILTDDLKNNFLYLGYALSGISFLLDPSFEEDIPKLNEHQNETIQQRLLLLQQIRSVKNDKVGGKDELRIENLQENLQKIVDDMSNEDFMDFFSNDFDGSGSQDLADDKDNSIHSKVKGISGSKSPDTNHEFSKKHLFDFEKSRSLSPDLRASSTRASPGVEGVPVSQMNPGITFRERKLYTSRYFFGDDMETRRSNDLYVKLHKYRYLIGKSLHIIHKFLIHHFHDNTKLFKHFLYVMNMWFSDVGRERLLDNSHAKIDYGFISAIQSINRVHKPYTRIALGSRVEAYHLLRVALHSTARTQTELDKILLEDLVKLSLSTYSAVAKPAQSTLIDAMKRLNGSYNVIIKSSLKYLSKALEEENLQKIESGLNLFNLKRIKSKVQNDYFNLPKFISLLQKCLLIDGLNINGIAQGLFKSIYSNITPPSSVCLIDMKEIDQIRPPDEFIDLEIKAVKMAKEKKRELYLDKLKKLQSNIITNQYSSSYWKLSSLNLSLLIDMQLDMEIPIDEDVFRLLAKEASSDHPVISRLALKGITKIINKVYTLQLMDHKLENIYNLDYTHRDIKVIDIGNKDDVSYYDSWRAEMANIKTPNYFVDNKVNNGWLFWGDTLKVVKPDPGYKLNLSEHDQQVLTSFSNCITKPWLENIVKLWVSDNEVNSSYQATDVHVTSTLVMLIANGFIENLSFEDLLLILESIYEKDDKSSHIVVCEILAGVLLSSKLITPELAQRRDEFVIKFLSNILSNDLSPDTAGIWNIFSWWVPSHIDSRRFPEITNLIIDFKLEKASDFAIKDATRLSYIRSFIAATTWRFSKPDEILTICIENMDHHYQAVREQIGSLLSMITFIYYPDSLNSFEQFTSLCNDPSTGQVVVHDRFKEVIPYIFKQVEARRLEVLDKTAQEILKSNYIYSSMTILTWLKQALGSSISIVYQDFMVEFIIPFLLGLINMKEVCQLGSIDPITVLKSTAQINYTKDKLSTIIDMLTNYLGNNVGEDTELLNTVQTLIMGEFTEIFYFKNLLNFTPDDRQQIIHLANGLLYHKQVLVREAAANTLSGLIHISPPEEVEVIIDKFSKDYKKSLDKVRRKHRASHFKNLTGESLILLHGATLGLGALIHAFALLSPPPIWVPDLLTTLVNKCSGVPGVVGKTAKNSLSKFKKTRQDTWHIDHKVFNEDQLQDLEGVLIKSYFI